MHRSVEPAILYFGTPVILVSTIDRDGTPNLAPISSAFWLGWRCLIGVAAFSKTLDNLLETQQCVLNLPSVAEAPAVNRLALTTGFNPVPPHKAARGYRHEPDKFAAAGLTPLTAETVAAPRVRECPVQLEAVVEASHGLAEQDARLRGHARCFELRIQRVHVDEVLLVPGTPERIDPERWRPLIMSFQRFYGLGEELLDSRLATIPEQTYRSPDIDLARQASPVSANCQTAAERAGP